MSYFIRPMQAGDIPQVAGIDKEAFPNQWPAPNFKKDLDRKVIRYLVACEEGNGVCHQPEVAEPKDEGSLHGFISRIKCFFGNGSSNESEAIACTDQNILGYASLWLMVDEAHLTSIAVRISQRRKGIGELLLISIIELAMKIKAEVVTLEVRASNLAAQALYEKYGFEDVGVRRGYYSENGEDAIIMTTERIATDSYQARLEQLKREYRKRWGQYASVVMKEGI